MLENPHVIQSDAVPMAFIHLKIPRAAIQREMGPGITEVLAAVSEQGAGPAGPWFCHHREMTPESFDFEICVPTTQDIAPVGRVKPGVLPAAKVARTTYIGPYEGLGDAWHEFMGWIAAQGLSTAPDLVEVYLVGPETGPDGANYRTELSRQLLD